MSAACFTLAMLSRRPQAADSGQRGVVRYVLAEGLEFVHVEGRQEDGLAEGGACQVTGAVGVCEVADWMSGSFPLAKPFCC
jgi:hypothetical protein